LKPPPRTTSPGRDVGEITANAFLLPTLPHNLQNSVTLLQGRGFEVLRGLSCRQLQCKFMTIQVSGTSLANARFQTRRSHSLGHVRNIMWNFKDPTTRIYLQTASARRFTDRQPAWLGYCAR
jgi:hypothetical protein